MLQCTHGKPDGINNGMQNDSVEEEEEWHAEQTNKNFRHKRKHNQSKRKGDVFCLLATLRALYWHNRRLRAWAERRNRLRTSDRLQHLFDNLDRDCRSSKNYDAKKKNYLVRKCDCERSKVPILDLPHIKLKLIYLNRQKLWLECCSPPWVRRAWQRAWTTATQKMYELCAWYIRHWIYWYIKNFCVWTTPRVTGFEISEGRASMLHMYCNVQSLQTGRLSHQSDVIFKRLRSKGYG